MTWSNQRWEPQPGPGLALLTALVQSVGTAIVIRGEPVRVGGFGYVLLVLSGFALADRHQFPRRNFLCVAAFTLAYHLVDRPLGLSFIAPLIAVSVAIGLGQRWLVWSTAAGSYVLWVGVHTPGLDVGLTVAAVIVILGLATEMATVAVRPIQQALRERRRLNEERQRRKASEERLQIAAELHDTLGHHLSLINLRAGVGLHLMSREPEQARVALDTIQQTSAEALREVQSVLATLYATGEGAPRSPAPGLDRLGGLTADAGLTVETIMSGDPRPLPLGVDQAAYRIVQEALTNVRRHAGPAAAATITIEYRPEALMIRIADNGKVRGRTTDGTPEPASAPAGNGITGMRERAAALGGSLIAGPEPDGGWRVQASLPLAADSPLDPGRTP